ncbi:MAG: hypothetical protein F6K36_08725 [Symploca sp. SIO3C6]|nr:hypothetical protein [Symploca sp. SIO3C6]
MEPLTSMLFLAGALGAVRITVSTIRRIITSLLGSKAELVKIDPLPDGEIKIKAEINGESIEINLSKNTSRKNLESALKKVTEFVERDL